MVQFTWLNMQNGLVGRNRSVLRLESCPLDHYWGRYVLVKQKRAPNAHPGRKGLTKEKLFIYLALAKPALPGQFVLFVSFQSKANVLKYFCLFRCAARNKSSDFWAAQKYFIIREQHEFIIFVSVIARNCLTMSSKNLITEQHEMLDFLKG